MTCRDCRWRIVKVESIPVEASPTGRFAFLKMPHVEWKEVLVPYCAALPMPVCIEERGHVPCSLHEKEAQP